MTLKVIAQGGTPDSCPVCEAPNGGQTEFFHTTLVIDGVSARIENTRPRLEYSRVLVPSDDGGCVTYAWAMKVDGAVNNLIQAPVGSYVVQSLVELNPEQQGWAVILLSDLRQRITADMDAHGIRPPHLWHFEPVQSLTFDYVMAAAN